MHALIAENFHCELLIAARPSQVYRALTTPDGLRGWWTQDCDIGTRIGEALTFRFGLTFKVMQIEDLQPNTSVRWRCIDAHLQLPGLKLTNEWIGTTIAFELEQTAPRQTRLKVEHIGLVPEFECYDFCTQGWQQFLGSLEAYAVTGTGMPYKNSRLVD